MGKAKGFFKEFIAFISKGNVFDLAVGVVIATAFSKIISSLVADIIMPLVALAVGKVDFQSIVITLKKATDGQEAVVMRVGSFLNAIVTFIIIGFSIFLAVKLMVSAKKKLEKAKETILPITPAPAAPPPPPTVEQQTLTTLEEIREILKTK